MGVFFRFFPIIQVLTKLVNTISSWVRGLGSIRRSGRDKNDENADAAGQSWGHFWGHLYDLVPVDR